jgi:hypothetical protein
LAAVVSGIYKKEVKFFLQMPGLGPNNENTLKISPNSCQILRLLKLLTNIFDSIHKKQF